MKQGTTVALNKPLPVVLLLEVVGTTEGAEVEGRVVVEVWFDEAYKGEQETNTKTEDTKESKTNHKQDYNRTLNKNPSQFNTLEKVFGFK